MTPTQEVRAAEAKDNDPSPRVPAPPAPPEASPKPPRGLPEASPKPPRSLPEASPRPPRGLPEASPKPPRSLPVLLHHFVVVRGEDPEVVAPLVPPAVLRRRRGERGRARARRGAAAAGVLPAASDRGDPRGAARPEHLHVASNRQPPPRTRRGLRTHPSTPFNPFAPFITFPAPFLLLFRARAARAARRPGGGARPRSARRPAAMSCYER
eukprot:gene15009-biopygen10066